MKTGLIFLFLSLFITSLFTGGQQQTGRENRILFRGVIISAGNQSRIPGAQIYRNRERYSVGRDDGTFSFYANRNDTVIFSSMGYKPLVFIVSDTLRAEEFITGIYMQSDTLEIGEVIIIPGLSSLRADLRNPAIQVDPELNNARSNLSIAAYQAKAGQNKLGDPQVNYEMIRQKQKYAAFEKGGIPSDQMVALSPFLLLPAAYLLIRGLPEQPEPPGPVITDKELLELNRRYFESPRNRQK